MSVQKTRLTGIILFCARCIPLTIRKLFFQFLFTLFYHLTAKHRLITLHNLRCAFPEKDMAELIKIAKGVYRNIAIMAAEFFDMPSITPHNVHKWVELEGREHYEAGVAQGKGILYFVAHFGNWELMAFVTPLLMKPMHFVYRPLDNPALDNIIEHLRTFHGNGMIPKGGIGKRVRELLQENQLIGVMGDQNVATQEGVFVDFFGRPACTGVGLAALALRSEAPILPAFLVRQKSGKYKLILKPLVEVSRTGDQQRDLLENTQRCTKIVEEAVREHPDQWLWLHQRWKTKIHQADKSG